MKQLISEKLINKALSIITAFVMVFLSITPTITTAFAAETADTVKTATPDTPESSLVEQTLTAKIYSSDTYRRELSNESTEITLTGKMPEGAVVKAYPVQYDIADVERSDEPKRADEADKISGEVLLSYDITIFDGKREFEPDGDTISVTFKSPELEDVSEDDLSVIHVKDNGEEELVEKSADNDNGELTVETDGFSVFVIIRHEGSTEVVTPRVQFHFIKQEPDKFQEVQVSGSSEVIYKADPFTFYNKAFPDEELQCTQFLTNGETLEMIANPPNIVDKTTQNDQYFYGWYVVNPCKDTGIVPDYDTTYFDLNTNKWKGNIYYSWPGNPKKISFEHPISITNVTNGSSQNTQWEVGNTVRWTIDDVTFEGELDEDGVAHVYLAPIYEDYFFVNFRMGARNDTSLVKNNLMTRKLVVFGSAETVDVRIGDIVCPSTDPQHLVFAGWQVEGTADDVYFPTIGDDGNETNSPGSTTGFYITLSKQDFNNSPVYNLYPFFVEARWLNCNTGVSGNGSTYVGSTYRLTNLQNTDPTNVNYYYDNDYFNTHQPMRNGYNMEGWYAFVDYDKTLNDQITNIDVEKNVTFKYYSEDLVNPVKSITFNMEAIKIVENNGGTYSLIPPSDNNNIAQTTENGVTYTLISEASTGKYKLQRSNNLPDIDLFSIKDGKLRFYRGIDDLTLYSNWVENTTTTYQVIIWKQKVTDHVKTDKSPIDVKNWLAEDSDRKEADYPYPVKQYDYEIYYVKDDARVSDDPNFTSFSGYYIDSNGDHQPVNNLNLNNFVSNTPNYLNSFKGFHYATDDIDLVGKPDPDGTSVYNIYYDRNVGTLHFQVNSGKTYSWSESTSENDEPVYGIVDGGYKSLIREQIGTSHTYTYHPSYTPSSEQQQVMYGFVNGAYVQLDSTATYGNVFKYKRYDEATDDNEPQFALQNGEYVPLTFDVVGTTTTFTYTRSYTQYTNTPELLDNNSYYGIYNGQFVQVYYYYGTWYRTEGQGLNASYYRYDGDRYTRNDLYNQQTYTGTQYTLSGTTFTPTNATSGTLYGMNGTTVYVLTANTQNNYGWMLNGSEYTGKRYKETNTDVVYSGQRYTRSGNNAPYTYTETDTEVTELYGVDERNGHVELEITYNTLTGYSYSYNGTPYTGTRYIQNNSDTVYTGVRYTDSTCATVATTDGDSWGKDANGYAFHLTHNSAPIYKWTYKDSNDVEHTYTGPRYKKTEDSTSSNQWHDIYTITALYQQNISKNFAITAGKAWNGVDYSEARWSPQNGGSINWNQVMVYIDAMPDLSAYNNGDFYFHRSTADNTLKHIHYYVETLPGETADRTYKGLGFKLHNSIEANYQFFTESEDYVDIRGFHKSTTYPPEAYGSNGTTKLNTVWSNADAIHVYCYYTRDSNDFTFDVNYPEAATVTYGGVTVAQGANRSSNFSVPGKVLYEKPLNEYGSSTGSDGKTHWYCGVNNSENSADHELIAPDHYVFGGWYEDATCTKAFNFDSTMPAANKIVYAKWTPESFRIYIDPNGGEIDHIDHNYDNNSSDPTKKGYYGYHWTVDYTEIDDLNGSNVDVVNYNNPSHNRPLSTFNRAAMSFTYTGTTPSQTITRPADSGYKNKQSTYFNADYGEPISEYTVTRNYVPISESAAVQYEAKGGKVFYYLNTQYKGEEIDGSSLPSDLRNALYMTNDELQEYHDFYRDWTIANLKTHYISGTKVMNYDLWYNVYEIGKQKYRPLLGGETYKFLGWFRVYDAGTENERIDDMPYVFSEPITSDITLRAMWRLDGGYKITYHADYVTNNGDIINGNMAAWNDPDETSQSHTNPSQTYEQLSYADGATTNIYRQPTGITLNGELTEEYIFRGFRIVTLNPLPDGKSEFVPLESDVYYQPGELFTINPAFAVDGGFIHMQAVYEERSSAYRRPEIANLTLDANGGELTDGDGYINNVWHNGQIRDTDFDLTHDSGWDSIGRVAGLQADLANNYSFDRIVFGDIQSNQDVHLYRYATPLTHTGGNDQTGAQLAPSGLNYFKHPQGFFLVGFDEGRDEGDFIATYPADSIISVNRKSNDTIYAVWEPLIYLNLENKTDKAIKISLATSPNDTTALYVLNEVTGIYDRVRMPDPSNVTIPANSKMHLALPLAENHTITISGKNELGVGRALKWYSSIIDGDTTYTSNSDATGPSVRVTDTYTHTYQGHQCVHDLPSNFVRNTETFTFDTKMLFNKDGYNVTFDSFDLEYALLLHDNYDRDSNQAGFQESIQEIDFTHKQVDVNRESYTLPSTSTRMGYELAGWAYSAQSQSPDFPYNNSWDIQNLFDFFHNTHQLVTDHTINGGKTTQADLYAVWRINDAANTVYIYKDVPEPGNKEKQFQFNLHLEGKFSNNAVKTGDKTFKLKHGQYAVLFTDQQNGTSSAAPPYLRTTITVKNADGTIYDTSTLSFYETYEADKGWSHVVVSVEEEDTSGNFYTTTVKRTALNSNIPIYMLNDEDDPKSNVNDVEVTSNTIHWYNPDAGGTVIFKNTRETVDVKVKKVLETNLQTDGEFNLTATYEFDEYPTVKVTKTKSFTSGAAYDEDWLKDIPKGAKLTISEPNSGSYITTYSVDDGTTWDSTTVVPDPQTNKQIEVETPEITVDTDKDIIIHNKLRTFKVRFFLQNQNNVGLEGIFSMSSQNGMEYELMTADHNNNGLFLETPNFYIGYYTLTERFAPSDQYIPLPGPASITAIGTSITTTSDMIEIRSPADPNDWYDIIVYNIWPSNAVTVKKVLDDPVLSQRTFNFTVGYTYTLPSTHKVIAHSEDISIQTTTAGGSRVVHVPGGSDVTVTENRSSAEISTYTTTVKIEGSSDPPTETSSWSDTVNANTTVLFTNTRKTANITVNKVVNGTSGSFGFEATLKHGANDLVRQVGVATGYYTDKNGHVYYGPDSEFETTPHSGASFSLGNSSGSVSSIVLTVPIGVTLQLKELSLPSDWTVEAVSASSANDLDANIDESFRFVVSGDDTITFTNTEPIPIAPTAVAQVAGTAFAELLMLCILGAGIYFVLSKRRKEVGYYAI